MEQKVKIVKVFIQIRCDILEKNPSIYFLKAFSAPKIPKIGDSHRKNWAN